MNTSQRLHALTTTHPDRHVGGPGNRAANDLFEDEARAAGFEVRRIPFAAREWVPGPSTLTAGGRSFEVHTGPFSEALDHSAPLVPISTVEELETLDAPGSLLLLQGPIAAEQLTPRNYPFYAMEPHARLLSALDAAHPAAVIAATGRTPMAHAMYPFPLFEDGDLGHPSVYLKDVDAEQLLAAAGAAARLTIDSAVRTVPAHQVVATKPAAASVSQRVVVCAHIDSRYGTPGALDNATGVCALLGVADLLAQRVPAINVELVPFNGEDDYAAPGEMAYLGQPAVALDEIALVINLDAAARAGDATQVSFYGCPDELKARVLAAGVPHAVGAGDEWPMSDHMVFAMRGVPSIALTSSGLYDISATVAHTALDTADLADPALIDAAAHFIVDLIDDLSAAND